MVVVFIFVCSVMCVVLFVVWLVFSYMLCMFFFFFFFQAEDGIRDLTVTGVQTCALPICREHAPQPWRGNKAARHAVLADGRPVTQQPARTAVRRLRSCTCTGLPLQIGRASCRKECRSRWSPYH